MSFSYQEEPDSQLLEVEALAEPNYGLQISIGCDYYVEVFRDSMPDLMETVWGGMTKNQQARFVEDQIEKYVK